MAHPRIFVSSTFFDLRQIREDLRRFIRELGYDAVLNEHGNIPYGKEEKLEEYCYREIQRQCDILVSIIGGRYGSASQQEAYSVSQMELKTAVSQGKQVYVFIEKGVYSEYRTYLANKDKAELKFAFVDNPLIYSFIEEVEHLPANNTIQPFETSDDITGFLREQWAGLFHEYLQENGRKQEIDVISNLQATARTLDDLVAFLTEEKKGSDQAVNDILLSNHPAMERIRQLLKVKYRVFFTNRDELTAWLEARQYEPVDEDMWDSPEYEEWVKSSDKSILLLKIRSSVFHDDGRLKVVTSKDWDKSNIRLETRKKVESSSDEFDPFQ